LIARLRREDGYSLIELLTTMAVMGIVMAALSQIMVSASKGETDMNTRFQAQQAGRVALARLRADVHCAASGSVTTTSTPPSAQVVLTQLAGSSCSTVTWCTAQMSGSTTRWSLYRQTGSTCSAASGVDVADYLTISNPFPTYTAQSASSLASLSVDLPVRVSSTTATYELKDTMYLRNSLRQ
jgi:prepilin-type N-terminal cleavage/methylation domain-containing protein